MEAGARVYVPGVEEHGEEAWVRGEVWDLKDGDSGGVICVVRLESDGSTREIDLDAFGGPLPLQNAKGEEGGAGIEDMCKMDHLHEAAILENLSYRSSIKLPYTYTGPIVLAVNPYEWIDNLYAPDTSATYLRMKARDDLPPHIYATAMTAYRGLVERSEDQSILVSGESGAGKTESVKIMMNMLAVASKSHGRRNSGSTGVNGVSTLAVDGDGGSHGAEVVDRVLRSNPLLEAFGNAKTARNDNSSRFGKFQQLEFDFMGVLVGSHCQTYLLEKSRVVGPGEGERNYHIFYQLLRGPEEWKAEVRLEGRGPEDFEYLSQGDLECDTIEGMEDGERFVMTMEALEVVGVEEERVKVMVGILAGILHIGNIELEGDDEKCTVVEACAALEAASHLLGCSVEELAHTLCYRTVKAGGEEYQVPMGQSQAQHCRDALAKEVYSRLFTWLVHRINRSTAPPMTHHYKQRQSLGKKTQHGVMLSPTHSSSNRKSFLQQRMLSPPHAPSSSTKKSGLLSPQHGALHDAHPFRHHRDKDGRRYGAICLLDIFGFESFEVNSFEQFLINFANETLQQKFCCDIFKGVQAEYDQEGVAWTHVDFKDNAETLALIEGRMGIISVLNEECLRPKGTEGSFTNKLAALHGEHPHFSRPKFASQDFIVIHYAGEVCYRSMGFIEKNRDTLQEDLSLLLSRSQVGLIADLFHPNSTVVEQQPPETPLHHGSGSIHNTPTKVKRQGTLVAETVATKFRRQLCTLMSEVSRTQVQYVRCLKPNTLKVKELFDSRLIADQLRYAGVIEGIRVSRAAYPNRLLHTDFLHRFSLLLSTSHRNDIRIAIATLVTPHPETRCQIGKTRVYFRAGVLEELEERRTRRMAVRLVKAQAAWRGYTCWRDYTLLRAAALRSQSRRRMVVQRRAYLTLQKAALALQCWARVLASQEELHRRRREASAVKLQSWVRGTRDRKAFITARLGMVRLQAIVRGRRAERRVADLKAQAEEQRRLEGQVQRLRMKLEEELRARELAEERERQAIEEAERRRETTAREDLQETVATLQRLQTENHMLREENDTLRTQVREMKDQMSQLQSHLATQEEKLASVLLTLKSRPMAEVMDRGGHGYQQHQGNGYHHEQQHEGLTVEIGSAEKAIIKNFKDSSSSRGGEGSVDGSSEAGTPLSPDGELDCFSKPLNTHWDDVMRDSFSCLPDPVNVTVKCGRRYLMEDKGLLRWTELNKVSGYRDACCFVLEKVPDFLAAKSLGIIPMITATPVKKPQGSSSSSTDPTSTATAAGPGAAREYFVLRARSNRRYVTLGGLFNRTRLRVSERRVEHAALFTLEPVQNQRHYHHQHTQDHHHQYQDDDDTDLCVSVRSIDPLLPASPNGGRFQVELSPVHGSGSSSSGNQPRHLHETAETGDGAAEEEGATAGPACLSPQETPGKAPPSTVATGSTRSTTSSTTSTSASAGTTTTTIPTARFLFTLMLHQPRRDPTPVVLGTDGFITYVTPNTAKAGVGLVDSASGGSIFAMEAMETTAVYQVLFKDKHLGMTVDSSTPLKVVGFTEADASGRVSEAERTGRIRFGDRIISANDKDLTKFKRSQCVEAIQGQRPILIGFQTVVSEVKEGSPDPDREQVPISNGRDIFEEVDAFFGGWDRSGGGAKPPGGGGGGLFGPLTSSSLFE